MTISIEDIKSIASDVKLSRSSFLTKLKELNNNLSKVLEGVDIYGCSNSLELETIGPDDWVYGFIYYKNGKLKVSYRTTIEDHQDLMNNIPDEYQTFNVSELDECHIGWLEKLASENPLHELMKSIHTELLQIHKNSLTSIQNLDKTLALQSKTLSDDLSIELKELDSTKLLLDWHKARNKVHSEPSESITRSSSYLESVCRLILNELSISLPKTLTITNLIQEVTNAIKLSNDDRANKDLVQIIGGVKSIFSGIGSMRTHFGTAHGSSPGDYEIDENYAELVNNAAACVSIYILQRYKKYRREK